jgi:serine protease Do
MMRNSNPSSSSYLSLSAMGLWGLAMMLAVQVNAEPTGDRQDALSHARQVTVGILADTQDPRIPEKPGKIVVRGTGIHLRDGYVITARHAAEKHDPTVGSLVQKQVRILTNDLNELPADLIGESTFMDVVVYRVTEPHRRKLTQETSFAAAEVVPGMEVFTVGYPLGWGPTMAFGRLGNTNTFLQTIDTRLIQADLSVCSGNSGGGLFNERGEIIGILHAVIQTDKEETQAHCSRMTFAVPGILVQRVVNATIAGQPVRFSKLGVHMASVKDGTKLRVAVKDVTEPAKSAGIQKHDILLAIEDTEILDGAQLKNYLIERTHPGQEVSIKVRRIDADLTFHVVLAGG